MPIDEHILKQLNENDLLFTELDLSKKEIVDHDLKILFLALENNIFLTELNLGDNNLTDLGAETIVHFLCTNKTLKKFSLLGAANHTVFVVKYQSHNVRNVFWILLTSEKEEELRKKIDRSTKIHIARRIKSQEKIEGDVL